MTTLAATIKIGNRLPLECVSTLPNAIHDAIPALNVADANASINWAGRLRFVDSPTSQRADHAQIPACGLYNGIGRAGRETKVTLRVAVLGSSARLLLHFSCP